MTRKTERLTSTVQMRETRLAYIDAIRGIGALMVAVQHPLEYAFPEYAQWSLEFLNLGRVGIVAFFLVSGYVVGLTLSHQTVRTFSIRRFWRLYPIYWVATLLYVLVLIATGEAPLDHTLLVVIVNVTMIQGFIGVQSILGVAWTLGIEIAFYAQSILGKIARVLDKTVWLGIFWLIVFAGMAGSNYTMATEFSAVMPLMMFSASLGLSLYLWEQKRSRALIVQGLLAIFLVPVLGWFLLSRADGLTGIWTPLSFDLSYMVGLILFAIFYALRQHSMSRGLLGLGEVSYSLYLVHTIVMAILKPLNLHPWLFVPYTIAGGIALAWVARILIERPSTGFGRFLTRKKTPPLIPETHIAKKREPSKG